MAQELGAAADFAGLTPANKVAALRAAGICHSRLTELLLIGAGLNFLTGRNVLYRPCVRG